MREVLGSEANDEQSGRKPSMFGVFVGNSSRIVETIRGMILSIAALSNLLFFSSNPFTFAITFQTNFLLLF